jgi:hypothetical protein
MKKALVGLANNIENNKDKIKVWYKSFKLHSDGDVMLIGANMSDNDKKVCEELEINFRSVSIENTWYINHKRLEHIRNWVAESDVDLVLSTDVFDVAFQADPFKKLDVENFDFFVGGEGVNVNQDPWNSQNISSIFGREAFEKCINKEIICSGVMAGKRDCFLSVYDRLFDLCENSSDGHNIKDQAALIMMITNNEIPKTKIFNLDDGWAVHCAVAGPTQFFESWGFKDNLKYGIPQMKEKKVCTAVGEFFDIVHQFNRIQEWEEIIRKSYL